MTTLTCSAGSAAVDEQLAGTAPHAVAWVALEQKGPWGPRAFTGSHLDPALGREIESAAAAHQTRPVLIRRPGRHADKHPPSGPDPRRVLVAFTHPRGPWLLEGTVESPDRLLDLDWAALRDGDEQAVRRTLPQLSATRTAHLLVCTNGTRDVCCATQGRPVALGMSRRFPDQVWEVTHTSGHRFAATAVILPAGTLHGRLDVAAAGELLSAAERGDTVLAGSRGRSTWPSPAQVAEIAVRRHAGEPSLVALEVTSHESVDDSTWSTVVRHRDGRSWTVTTEAHESETLRAESCGKALKPLSYTTTAVR